MNARTSIRLLETDMIEWTPEKLARRIEETRELIQRIDTEQIQDEDFSWIRKQLAEDLLLKEGLLEELKVGSRD